MSTNQFENQICEAIELIVNKAVASAGYDKTIRAHIVSCVDQTIGKYKIKYQDNVFFAYTENTDVKYSKGTEVYVLVHNNDLNMNKTIIGSVKKLGLDYINNVSSDNRYEKIGTNLITESGTFGLCSYIDEEIENITSALSFLKLAETQEYIKKSSHIMIEADISTNLSLSQRYKGNYGLQVSVQYYATAADKLVPNPEFITKTYVLDINNMTGEPYALTEKTRQFAIFKIEPELFYNISNVSIFEKDFPEQKDNQPDDIFIEDISVYAMSELSEQELLNCYLSVLTPQGTYFDEQNLATDEKSMQAQIVVKGAVVDESSQEVKYYWFKENTKVSTADLLKYNKYAGAGWECLNQYNIISSNEEGTPAAIEWLPGSNTFGLTKEEILSNEVVYKCVAIYDTVILSKDITFKNMDAPYEITIVSDSGTTFYEGVGSPTLTCLINDLENTSDYTYYWITLDNNNLLAEVNSSNNKVENINVKAIIDFITYKCAVYLNTDNSYLGCASITLVNGEALDENEYTFILNNGTQVFKYDEDGVSPTSISMDNPQEIFPLSFTTYDSAGALIPSEMVCAGGSVKWIVPFADETLISVAAEYGSGTITEEGIVYSGYPTLNYTIASRFNSSKINNKIKLEINYDGFIYKAETSFSFIKEGDPGTNGTSYYCRILPNAIAEQKVAYPLINYNLATSTYSLNYDRPVGQEQKWFKVQLWENDHMIFEDVANTTISTAKPYKITWSVPKKKYSSSVSDVSDISVTNNETGTWTFTKNSNNIVVNIVKCEVQYNNQNFIASLPIITALNSNANYNLSLKENTGFSFVRYASDGTSPKYNGTNLFELILTENSADITQQEGLVYNWTTQGAIYDLYTSQWQQQLNLTIPNYSNQTIPNWQRIIRPDEPYDGECLSNFIECSIINNGTVLSRIRIPIHMYLNRYGLAALNDWDGNYIDINENGGYILSPQVGAGTKDANNNFTGILMGEVRESGKSDTDIGLLGYADGIRSIFLDAETGKAEFGTAAKIVIDPTDGTARLYSGNYSTTNNTGMLIDLSEPSIRFGSGDFVVNSSGFMTAKGGGNIAGWAISDNTLTGNQVGIKSKGSSNTEYAFWAGSNTPGSAEFRVNFDGKLYAENANISGKISATEGKIGDWAVYDGKLVGAPEYDRDGDIVDYSIRLNADTSKGDAIVIGENFSVSATGDLSADSGTIGGWEITENAISSENTILWSNGNLWTDNISIYESGDVVAEGGVHLGDLGYVAGETTIENIPTITHNLGIVTDDGYGIIFNSGSHIGIKATNGIWLSTDNGYGVYLNGEDITIARFG